ncbi:MAG TPA: oligosaccharide flippase family protein [Candidatus Acidoferrales bacterium]|nr:oligosaccharide flippase family protein [Candidatus Acidoferrales bacterium]
MAQLINVVGTLLLAHLFAPDAFGSFALFLTVVSFLSVLGGARYELAIMLPESDLDAANILLLSVLVLCGISGLSLLLVALFPSAVARLLGDARLGVWLWGAPIALFVNALYSILCVWYGRMKRFQKLATARVLQSAGIIFGQLALLTIRPGGFALVGGWVLGQTFGTLILVVQLFYHDGKFVLLARDWKVVRQSLTKYGNFPIYKAPYSFVANASSQLVFVILRIFSSLNVVGFYSMAARAVYLPVTLIASSMNDVFYEKAASELKHGRLETFVTRLLRIQVVLAAPWLVLTAFDAKLVFGLILGPKWVPAASYAAVLASASFLYFLTSWLDRLFDIRGHQKLSLMLEFAGNVLSLGGLTLALWRHPERTVLAIMIFAAIQVLYSSVWLIFAYHVAEFSVRALTVLLRDAVVSVASATFLMGGIHMILHGWPAFLASAMAALGLTGFAFVRYVSTGRAFASPVERFRQFWADKDSTLNGREGEDFWRAQANELKNLYSSRSLARVLEIGCGDGSLFPYFEIPAANYKGVDFTPQFIERFRSKAPGVHLECAEGASYLDQGTKYDLILLNGIVQHFDPKMLEEHLQNARAMMRKGGQLVWGSIPRKRHRRAYDAGKWSGSGKISAIRLLRSWGGRLLGLDAMGYWYEPEEVAGLAKKYGLHAQFVPSKLYPYRFHAVLTETQTNQPGRNQSVQSASNGAAVRRTQAFTAL